jgi:GNAT superfamily N-acetyltransferase
MPNISVIPVHSRREKKTFFQFAWDLYRDDPNWVPPIRGDIEGRVGFQPHPFYEENECQAFIARKGDQVCGRIVAIHNKGHNSHYNDKVGFFGFFESINDKNVANALFNKAAEWFSDRDIEILRGPTNPSLNYELGLLIDGFDLSPTFMMTYNPDYYPALLEGYGFEKTQDLLSFYGHVSILPKIHERHHGLANQIADRFGLTIRPCSRKNFSQDVKAFLDLYNRSLVNTWGFVPMSDAEVRHTAAALKHLIVPELAVVAELDGRIIGACFGLPDFNPRIRAIGGKLLPFGFARLLWKKHRIKKVRMISTNVLPEYQRMGVGLVLLDAMVPQALKWKLEEAEFSWVLESNSLSRGSLEKGGAVVDKVYRLYDKPIT